MTAHEIILHEIGELYKKDAITYGEMDQLIALSFKIVSESKKEVIEMFENIRSNKNETL